MDLFDLFGELAVEDFRADGVCLDHSWRADRETPSGAHASATMRCPTCSASMTGCTFIGCAWRSKPWPA